MTSTHSSSPTGCGTYFLIGILAVLLACVSGQVVRLRAVDCEPMTDYPRCAPEAGFPFIFVQDDYSTWSTLGHTGVLDWEDYLVLHPWAFAGNVLVYGVLLLFGWWGLRLRATHQIPTALRLLAPFATIAILVVVAGSFNFRPYRPERLPTPTPIPTHITNLQQRWQMQEADTRRTVTLEFGPADRATLYLPDHMLVGSYTWQTPSSLFLHLNAYTAPDGPTPLQCDALPAILRDACQTSVVAYSGPALDGRLIVPPSVSSNPYAYTAPPTQAPVEATYLRVNRTLQVQVDATRLILANDAGGQQVFTRAP